MRNLSVRRGLKQVKINKDSVTSFGLIALLLGLTLYPLINPQKTNAAVTESFVRFDRLSTGTSPITGSACLNTSTSGTETGVTIVFPGDWTISSTPGNWTVTTTNLPTGAGGGASTAWPGINTATSVNGASVTFPSTDLSTGTLYCFNFTGASSTIGAAGNNKTGQLKTNGGTPYVDSVDWATSVVGSNADQITVTASVSATMTFSLSGSSVNLGTLSPSSPTYDSTGITQTVSTNARNGWISWVRSANAGLDSTVAAPSSIDSVAYTTGAGNIVNLSSSTGYVLDVVPGTGTPTVATEYDGNGSTSGGNLDTIFRQTASAADPANGDQVALHVAAKPSNTTAAANDYTDTLTVVAAGSF